MYIASCSFGKDSIATILLALEHNEPLDRVVFAEVMFDNSRGISGEIPEHIEWIYKTAIPRLENIGIKVDVVRGTKDYVHYFTKQIRQRGKYEGKLYGFPVAGMCTINRDCKINPIHKYFKQFDKPIIQYIGIAKDEPKRLSRLKENQISLLDKYGYTEEQAKALCIKYSLLSPLYSTSCRGGCWFCPNSRFSTLQQFRHNHSELWCELERHSKTPNLCSYGFKYGMTIDELNRRLDSMDNELKLF